MKKLLLFLMLSGSAMLMATVPPDVSYFEDDNGTPMMPQPAKPRPENTPSSRNEPRTEPYQRQAPRIPASTP